jgi:ssRNA-specific RNase YbeY (16S rRNA maturation enzyme)
LARITFIVTGDAGIKEVKSRCFGIDAVTDVVAAAYEPVPGDEEGGWTAEVVVNAERAAGTPLRSATWSPDKELALYIAHGIDHLCGGRDDTARGRNAMRRRELRWLKAAAAAGLLDGLLATRKQARTARPRPDWTEAHAD